MRREAERKHGGHSLIAYPRSCGKVPWKTTKKTESRYSVLPSIFEPEYKPRKLTKRRRRSVSVMFVYYICMCHF